MLLPPSLFVGNQIALCRPEFLSLCAWSPWQPATPSLLQEKNNMVRLYGMLPVKKRELVIGRYLLILAQGVFCIGNIPHNPAFRTARCGRNRSGVWSCPRCRRRAVPICARYGVSNPWILSIRFYQRPGVYVYSRCRFFSDFVLFPQMPADRAFITILGGSPVFLVASVIVLVIVMYAVSVWFSIRIMKTRIWGESYGFHDFSRCSSDWCRYPRRNKWIRKFRDKKGKRDDRSSMWRVRQKQTWTAALPACTLHATGGKAWPVHEDKNYFAQISPDFVV